MMHWWKLNVIDDILNHQRDLYSNNQIVEYVIDDYKYY